MAEALLRWVLLAGLILASASSTGAQPGRAALHDEEAQSFESLEVGAFQGVVARAHGEGAAWVTDALAVGLRFIGPFEGRSQRISRENDSGEAANKAEIVVVEDGYLDDSVRGAWYRLTAERREGVWTITSAQRAWRCWPGRGHEGYAAQGCR